MARAHSWIPSWTRCWYSGTFAHGNHYGPEYRQLLALRRAETKMIVSIATKLRITPRGRRNPALPRVPYGLFVPDVP
jgi:hypothetical protein